MTNVSVSDGLDSYRDDDDAGSNLIKGTKLKFTNDSEWVGGRRRYCDRG
jgi:hypothetical protein